jgi:hypothetical protein
MNIISISQIAIQATQDAKDASQGHKVANPYYPHRPDAAIEWQKHFDTWMQANTRREE